MKTLSTTQDTLGDVAHTLGDVVTDGAELVADIADDLTDVAESAVATVASTSRAGLRIVGRTVAFVARRPREVAIGVAVVVVLAAALGFLKSRSSDSSSN